MEDATGTVGAGLLRAPPLALAEGEEDADDEEVDMVSPPLPTPSPSPSPMASPLPMPTAQLGGGTGAGADAGAGDEGDGAGGAPFTSPLPLAGAHRSLGDLRSPESRVYRSPLQAGATVRRVPTPTLESPGGIQHLIGAELWRHWLTPSRLMRAFYLAEYLSNVSLLKAPLLMYPNTVVVASCLAIACHALQLPPAWTRTLFR